MGSKLLNGIVPYLLDVVVGVILVTTSSTECVAGRRPSSVIGKLSLVRQVVQGLRESSRRQLFDCLSRVVPFPEAVN